MKTPEELAEEFAKINGRFNRLDGTCLYLRNAFLVGYKTAQKMNSPEKPDGWISVKDRMPLPEPPKDAKE